MEYEDIRVVVNRIDIEARTAARADGDRSRHQGASDISEPPPKYRSCLAGIQASFLRNGCVFSSLAKP